MVNKLHKTIMRRVYYTFALRTLSNPVTIHVAFVATMFVILSYFVSFWAILANVSSITVGRLDNYAYNAIVNTEVWTLVVLALIIFAFISLHKRLRTPQLRHVRFA